MRRRRGRSGNAEPFPSPAIRHNTGILLFQFGAALGEVEQRTFGNGVRADPGRLFIEPIEQRFIDVASVFRHFERNLFAAFHAEDADMSQIKGHTGILHQLRGAELCDEAAVQQQAADPLAVGVGCAAGDCRVGLVGFQLLLIACQRGGQPSEEQRRRQTQQQHGNRAAAASAHG